MTAWPTAIGAATATPTAPNAVSDLGGGLDCPHVFTVSFLPHIFSTGVASGHVFTVAATPHIFGVALCH